MKRITIQIGDELLDVDGESGFGLSFRNQWLDFGRDGGVRSYDISVPATRKNNRIFGFHESPSMDGVRSSARAAVTLGGVRMDGDLFVDEWSGGRYSLLFVTGYDDNFGRAPDSSIFTNTLTYDKTSFQRGGTIPDFGLYVYNNDSPAANPVIYPTANLGYLIDTIAGNLGYSVTYSSALRLQDAHAFGLVLDRMEVREDVDVTVVGHALKPTATTPAWAVTVSTGTLADAGLAVTQKTYKRGDFLVECQVWVFKALRDVTIRVPGSQGILIAKGNGNDIVMNETGHTFYNLGQRPETFDLEAGDWFSVGSWDEVHGGYFGGIRWNLAANPHGFTTDLNFTFSVERVSSSLSSYGDLLRLSQNLPDMSLEDYLTNFCLLTCQVWVPDIAAKTIEVRPLDAMLASPWQAGLVERMRLAEVGSVKKYVDGWARHNYVRCKSADYVNESCKFVRDYEQGNDYPEDERDAGTVAWNEGNWNDANGEPALFLDDIITSDSGELSGKGKLTILAESASGESARHVEVLNREGIGETFRSFIYSATTVRVTMYMKGYEFLRLNGTDGRMLTWGGRRWIVREGNWSDGAADLTLLSV